MDRLRLFVPRPTSILATILAPGSAIVGPPAQPSDPDPLLVYYEGNIYGSSEMETFEAKARIAAGRLGTNYPTTAKTWASLRDLVEVGTFCTTTWQAQIDPEMADAILAWEQHGQGSPEETEVDGADLVLKVELQVRYACNGTKSNWLKSQLETAIGHAVGDGALTGASDAEVESWSLTIHEIK